MHTMKSARQAEAYCDRQYDQAQQDSVPPGGPSRPPERESLRRSASSGAAKPAPKRSASASLSSLMEEPRYRMYLQLIQASLLKFSVPFSCIQNRVAICSSLMKRLWYCLYLQLIHARLSELHTALV